MNSIYVKFAAGSSFREVIMRHYKDIIDIVDISLIPDRSVVVTDFETIKNYSEEFMAPLYLKGIYPYVIVNEICTDDAAFLKRTGIGRVIKKDDLDMRGQFLFSESVADCEGSILLIDGDSATERIISSIGSVFGYKCKRAQTLDESVDKISEGYSIVLHNLAYHGIDRYNFMKRMPHSGLAQTPYVAFKSYGSRITLEDIQCGVSRFTRVILSLDEMYSVIINNLFRKEFYKKIECLNEVMETKKNSVYADESLKKLFFAHSDLFYSDGAAASAALYIDNSDRIMDINKSLSKLVSFSWLLSADDRSRLIEEGACR